MSDAGYELFLLSDVPVAFIGTWGDGGLWRWLPATGWTFHPRESTVWDGLHQEAYRNFKADPLTLSELEARGVPPPPVDAHRGAPALAWEDNFRREMPLGNVPAFVRQRLGESERTVYLILSEDEYETRLGDGKYLYPEAAFWDPSAAQAHLARLQQASAEYRKEPSRSLHYTYTLKEVRLRADPLRRVLAAELGLNPYEHDSIEDVVRLLAERPAEG
jgi:hypothetical protein